MIGIDKGATNEAETLVGKNNQHHFLMVRALEEMFDGKAGHEVVVDMIADSTYSK